MDLKKIIIIMAAVFSLFFIAGISIVPTTSVAAPPEETPTPQAQPPEEVMPQQPLPPDTEAAIREAFQTAVQQQQTIAPAFMVYDVVIDHIQYSQDGTTALVWLALRDRETGEIVPGEAGLSIAKNPDTGASAIASSWTVVLPPESIQVEQIQTIPDDLMTSDVRNRYLDQAAEITTAAAQVFSGYKLPWTAGLAKYMTNSIGHVYSVSGGYASCPSTCRYAFDFSDRTMFPMLAAKGGTVKAYKTSCSNGDSNCTNYLVLEDQSTIPTTYQLYYHMANNTIPSRLQTIGASVRQGEYIGDADDTGNSTGNHLHFHVYITPTGTNWSWGTSQDITFDDVSVNGGRPRTCAEASEYPDLGSQCASSSLYTSGNTPANPPTGRLDLPADRSIISSSTLHLQGVAQDDIQIKRIQVLVNYDGTWNTLDEIPAASGTFSRDIDMCAAGIPDGPFALSVRIYDREGSLANIPVRQLVKTYACGGIAETPPPTSCTPASNQVALYSDPDFRGDCVKFTAGSSYTSSALGVVGNDNAASIQVGSGVWAVVYDRSEDVNAVNPNGRIDTITYSDANLADNRVGADQVSGLRVITRTTGPSTPLFNSSIGSWVASGINPTSVDSLVLTWEGSAGATSFDVNLSSSAYSQNTTVTDGNSLSVGTLPVGDYQLSVTARNSAGTTLASKSFRVDAGTLPEGTKFTAPFEDTVENGINGWIASGLWRRDLADGDYAWISNRNGFNYDDLTWRAGDLTSPIITLPAGQVYYLRFDYFMNTEDGNSYWDQRRVQISANGGRFVDLYQLKDDKQEGQFWLNSGPISLADYAGQEIRLRFHFDTVDEDRNDGSGWTIDNITVTSTAPDLSCADNDNTPETAETITIGTIGLAMICPEQDVDYYKFTVNAGQPVIVDIDAKMLPTSSLLDSMVFLLDADGRSVVAYNDDEQLGILQDSWLSYIVGRSGTYYLKIKPWDYPGAGSRGHVYQLSLRSDIPVPPRELRITYPVDRKFTPVSTFDITVSTADFDGGPVAQVDFYWHGPDWSSSWVKLGSDTDGSNGWSYPVNPASYGGTAGSAMVVVARSRTGGYLGTAMWDLLPDLTIPVSAMNTLPATTNSNVVRLSWSASDTQNDIVAFDLQYQVNNGSGWSAWQDWAAGALPGSARATWMAGTAGSSYRFRMRARDKAGNAEAYPASAEASTSLASACTPDSREGEGQTIQAPILLPSGAISGTYNLCSSSQAGAGGGDVDWFSFNAQQGEEMLLLVLQQGGGAAFTVNLYKEQSVTSSSLVNTWSSTDYGQSVSIRWQVPETGTYYLSVQPLHAEMFGTDMGYKLWVGKGNWLNMPIISR